MVASHPSGKPIAPARKARSAQGLDRIDRAILEALRLDGRITYQALSERVGLSSRPCLERVRRLEASGVIGGYTALIDPSAIGHNVIALAEIAMRDPSAATRQRLERALKANAFVVELEVVSGEYDYVARIVAPSLAEYEALTDAFLTDPAFGVARIHTTFVLRILKEFRGYPAEDSGK
jgi:DNA-binding Lrp family transcriptional regulator